MTNEMTVQLFTSYLLRFGGHCPILPRYGLRHIYPTDRRSKRKTQSCGVLVGALPMGCICGDADGSGFVDIDDVMYILGCIFTTGCEICQNFDANLSGYIDIDDLAYLIAYIFVDGPPPCGLEG